MSGVSMEMAAALGRGAQREGLTLTLLYDAGCQMCRRLRDWLSRQPALLDIEYLAADSAEAHARFPELDHARTRKILTVVTSDGAVYEADKAWLVCAWAMPQWRPVAERMSSPFRRRFVRLGGNFLDVYRHRSPRQDACCPR